MLKEKRVLYNLGQKLKDGILFCWVVNHKMASSYGESTSGICGAHQSAPKLNIRLKKLDTAGLLWLGFHEIREKMPSVPTPRKVYTTTAWVSTATSHLWPFAASGMDIVDPFEKAMVREYKYILAVMDYFSKGVEVIVVRDFTMLVISDFHPNQFHI